MNKPQANVDGERRLAERTEKAARLRARRRARKLTQEALAKELGVVANTIARWERYEMPLPHWVIPHLALQRQVAELTSALTQKDKAQKKLRETIKSKNFELQIEKATRKSSKGPTANQLHRKLCTAFRQDRTTLVKINEIYVSLTKPSMTIDEKLLYRGDSEPQPADGA